MNVSVSIREVIRTRGECQPRQILEALGITDPDKRMRVYWAIAVMYREGVLDRRLVGARYAYRLLREPVRPAQLTPEQRKARAVERDRKRHNRRPRDVVNAERRRQAAERKAQLDVLLAQRKEQRARERAQRRQAPILKPRHVMPVCVPARPSVTAAAKPVVRRESVSEFLARGGRVQRLPPGQMAESSLRFKHGSARA